MQKIIYFSLCLALLLGVSSCDTAKDQASQKAFKAGAGQVQTLKKAQDFEKLVLKKKGVVLVKFYTDECPACRALTPTIQELAGKYKGKVDVIKVNCNSFKKLTISYGIQGVPAVFIFNNGMMLEKIMGLRKRKKYEAVIEKALSL